MTSYTVCSDGMWFVGYHGVVRELVMLGEKVTAMSVHSEAARQSSQLPGNIFSGSITTITSYELFPA